MKAFSIFAMIVLVTANCSKKNNDKYPPGTICQLKAVVTGGYDLNCGTPLLSFEDSVVLGKVLRFPFRLASVNELPAALNVKGKKLLVCIAPLQPDDAKICIALYQGYPAFSLIKAEEDQ